MGKMLFGGCAVYQLLIFKAGINPFGMKIKLRLPISLLNELYEITYPEGEIRRKEGKEHVSSPLQILILHYLTGGYMPFKGGMDHLSRLSGGRRIFCPLSGKSFKTAFQTFRR